MLVRGRHPRPATAPVPTPAWTWLRNRRVPMRDGVHLAMDVLLPPGDGPFPTVVVRTPYDKHFKVVDPRNLLRDRLIAAGYAYAVQDVRGRFNSEGEWRMYFAEREDGEDTLEWVARQTWCDGSIGMTGGSYEAQAQWFAALSQHPGLKAIVPLASPAASLWDNEPIRGGALLTQMAHYAVDMGLHSCPIEHVQQMWSEDRPSSRTLPVSDVVAVEGAEAPFWDEWVQHPTLDDFWRRGDFSEWGRIQVPALHVTGWWDMALAGTLHNFPAMRAGGATARARDGQRVIIGPWPHALNRETVLNGLPLGDGALVDLADLQVEFFDEHLRGRVPDELEPTVHAFVVGAGEWWAADAWPPQESVEIELLLGSGGRANTRGGDGTLSEQPRGSADRDFYTYDPGDPVHHFVDLCTDGPVDDGPVSDREDVLCYTTDPLEEPLDVLGPVRLHLWAATSARDADWHARLVDVEPDGTARYLCHGVLRARFREGYDASRLLAPDVPVELRINMDAVGVRFRPGHRVRLEVTSSWSPRYNVNTGTGAENWFTDAGRVVARQSVRHDAAYQSRLVLPVVPPASA